MTNKKAVECHINSAAFTYLIPYKLNKYVENIK